MIIEVAGHRVPDYVLLLTAYPALLIVMVITWLVTRVRPKKSILLLQFRAFGLSLQIKNGHVERRESIGEINESTETD